MPRVHDPDLIAALGRRLREVRRARGMAQERLAELIPVEPETLSRAETGSRALSISNLARAAEALQVPLSALFELPQADIAAQDVESAEHELVVVYRRLGPAHRRVVVRLATELEAAERSLRAGEKGGTDE